MSSRWRQPIRDGRRGSGATPLRRRIAEDRSDGSSDLRRQVRRSLVFPDLFPGFVPVARGVERSLLRARRKAATLRRSSIASARWEAHRDRVALVKRFVFGLDTRARSSADTSPVSGNMIAMRYVAAHELRFRMPSRSSDRQGWISRVQFLVRSPLRSRFTGASHIGLAR